MRKAFLLNLLCGLLLAFALNANVARALPIAYGDVNFQAASATLGSPTDATTTSFLSADFIKAIMNDTVMAGDEDGAYSALNGGGASVSFATPFNFVSLETASPTFTEPLWTITSGGVTYSFSTLGPDMVTYSKNVKGVVTGIDIQGDGTATITGYAPNEDASYNIQIGTTGGRIGFQVENSAPQVPDQGATALLIGLGLAAMGLGLVARRRVDNAA